MKVICIIEDLHFGDFGIADSQPYPAVAQHWVSFVQLQGPVLHLLQVGAGRLGQQH